MFTGLITAIGKVSEAHQDSDGLELSIEAGWPDLVDGESIAVDGACLTVTRHDDHGFRVHVIRSSLDRDRKSVV